EVDNKKLLIGSASLVKSTFKDNSIYLKIDNDIIAKLELTDSIKIGIKETINKLNKMNIKTMIFTGDEKSVAESIAKQTNIKEVKYELLPEDKYNLLEQELESSNKKVAFVGDGINDAPSLARADIGISMGSVGSASAIEASDVVIISDDINKIVDAISISKKTDKIIKENLIFAIGIKILVLTLTAIGISTMWQAVFADTGVTLLTIINTTRILKYKKR
ncbi:MAG: HAD-IC family P-type ATPase, partial [Bacilli bacterium]|nr:HAD-IC family P-type ATPase [Bacilli bacterium]